MSTSIIASVEQSKVCDDKIVVKETEEVLEEKLHPSTSPFVKFFLGENITTEVCYVCDAEFEVEENAHYQICECGYNCCDDCVVAAPDPKDGERYCDACVPSNSIILTSTTRQIIKIK